MVLHEFSDDDTQPRLAKATRKFHQRLRAMQQELSRLLHQAETIEHELETQEVGAPAREFLAQQLGQQPSLAPVPGHVEVNNTVSTARRFVTAASKTWLGWWKTAAWIGTIVMAGVDILAVWHVTGHMTANQYGGNNSAMLERGGLACLTLVGYWLMGIIYGGGGWWRRSALAMYGIIVALLTWGLAPTWMPKFQEMFGGIPSVLGGHDTADWLVLVGAWIAVVALACVFSFAGLLFLVMKNWLLSWLALDHQHAICLDIIAKADQAQAARVQAQQLGDNCQYALEHQAELIAQDAQETQEQDVKDVQQHHDSAAVAFNSIRTSAAKRREAETIRLASERALDNLRHSPIIAPCLLVGIGLLGLTGCSSPADSAQQVEAKAPTMQILADCSTSSPLYEQTFVDSVMRSVIRPKILALPMASRVIVTCIGDSSKTPVSYDGRVQTINNANGGTPTRLAQEVHRLLQSVPSATRYERSELMFGFAEAAKKINPAAAQPNPVIALSDLIEHSALADCRPKVKAKDFCKLPAPAFAFANTEMIVLGVAVGLPADKALLINNAWKDWFLKAGLDQQRLVMRRD